VRLFFALWPPRAAAQALSDWLVALQEETAGRPVQVGNIHLTLAFLGEADPDKARMAAKQVRGRRHTLPIEEAHYWKQNAIVWVGPRSTPEPLEELVRGLHAVLTAASFTLEKRPFAAHVTLLRKARAVPALPPPPRVEWPVDEFLLVRSRVSREGPSYEPLERFSL
jgi:2'-5' RNA ligase